MQTFQLCLQQVLRTNTALVSLMENLVKFGDLPDPADAKREAPTCVDCEERPVTQHCKECAADQCESCSKHSHALKSKQGHKLVAWTPAVAKAAGVDRCKQHEEKLKLFCNDCQLPICVICKESSAHEGHKTKPVNEVCAQVKQGLAAAAEEAKTATAKLEAEGKRLAEVLAREEEAIERAQTQIRLEMTRARALIDAREQQLLVELKERGEDIIAPIHTEQESVIKALSLASALAEEASRALARDELGALAAKKPVRDRLAELKKSAGDVLDEPWQFEGARVVFGSRLYTAANTHGRVGPPAAPSNVRVTPSATSVLICFGASDDRHVELIGDASAVVLLRVDKPDAKQVKFKCSTLSDHTITELEPETAYRMRVSVIDDGGASDWSETICFTTLHA